MKKIQSLRRAMLALVSLAVGLLGHAQTADDLLRFSVNDVQGTARFSGMGGAFTALGGDFSSLSVNPAGIGIYRSSEFSITPAVTSTSTSTDYLGTSISESRVRFGLSNLGYIGNYTLSNKSTGLISVSYGLGYNKLNDFHRSASMVGFNSRTSLLDSYEETANWDFSFEDQDFILSNSDGNVYPEFPANQWTAVGAVATGLVYNYYGQPNSPDEYRSVLYVGETVDQDRQSWRSGSVGEYVMSFGANISNKIYLGATIGLQDLRFEESITFLEDGDFNLSALELDVIEDFRTNGFGINGKFGVIFRPVDEFRVGAAVHTPTFYEMEELYSVWMRGSSSITNPTVSQSPRANIYNYRMQSPYRLEFGLAYTINQVALLSLDYELVGYNAMRMRNNRFSGFARQVNRDITDSFRASSNIRVGVEGNLGSGVLLRGGFNFIQSPYRNTPGMRNYGISSSDYNRFVYAFGIGYRSGSFFTDFAYTLNVGNYFFQPYTLEPVPNVQPRYDENIFPLVPVAKERERKGRFMLTLGFKF